jgi:phage baseplate assembly protein W
MAYQDDLIGADIRRTVDGDIGVSPGGDMELTSGMNNVIQAVNSALMTYKGFDSYVPNYGSLLLYYQGRPNTTTTRYGIANTVKEALLSCPKVSAVPSITTEKTADNEVTISMQIVPVTEDQMLNYTEPFKL